MKELLKTIIEKLDELITLFKDGPINVTGRGEYPVTIVEYTPPMSDDVIKIHFTNGHDAGIAMHDFTRHGHVDDKSEHMQPDEFLQFSLNQGVSIDAGGENQPRPQRMDDGGTKAINILAGVIVDGPDELMGVIAKSYNRALKHGGGFILQYINGDVIMFDCHGIHVFSGDKWQPSRLHQAKHKPLVESKMAQVYINRADADFALYTLLSAGHTQSDALVHRLCEQGYNYVLEAPGVMLRQSVDSTRWEEFYLDGKFWRLE